jgi:signal transduction histidine kinase
VELTVTDAEVILAVTNARPPSPAPVVDRGGHGIPGMRERVRVYGGSLDVGPVPGGGWGVRARIPLGPA